VTTPAAQLEDTFRLLAEKSPNMIFINRGGRVVFANHRCKELLGFTPEEICDEAFDFRGLIAPESQELVDEYFGRHMQGQDVAPYEYTLITREGQLLQVINTTRAILYGGEQAILGIVTDVTSLRQAREALQHGEQRYRELVNHCPDAILMSGLAGDLVLANRQAAQMLGYDDAGELQQRVTRIDDLLAPEDQDRVQRELLSLIAEGGVRLFEATYMRRGGGCVLAEAHYTLVRDEAQRPTAFIGVIRDTTRRQLAEQERRRVEAQMQHAQKLESLGLLAGGIAHDFNNLLVGMLGNASLALAELPGDAPVRTRLEQIELAAARAAELTEQLLAYSGAASLSHEVLDLAKVARRTVETARARLPAGVTVALDCPEELPPLRGDADRLEQALLNLLTNAEEAMAAGGGTISVELGPAAGDDLLDPGAGWRCLREPDPGRELLALRVRDTGRGIDDDTLSKAFDPFFSTKGEGRGLGLAAVLGIIRGHGGGISLGTHPGGGAEVRILLPVAEQAPRPTLAPRPCPTDDGGLVLVVDDELVVRRVARGMLEKMGHLVVEASSGVEALEIYEQRRDQIMVVLLDLTMPGMDGLELLGALRELSPDLPVVLSSGFSRQESAVTLTASDGVDFIQKPYRLGQLRSIVRRALRRGR
jgi:two-component system cell cycle sensor histidine kinase/response regulator CckA